MRVNIYIRKDNESKWAAIEDKSDFVNALLEEQAATVVLPKPIKPLPKIEGVTTADKLGVCQGHAMRWDCGLKGCKLGNA